MSVIERWLALTGLCLALLAACGPGPVERTVVVTVKVTVTPGTTATLIPEGGVLTILADEQRARWTARLPQAYADRSAPFPLDDVDAVQSGEALYLAHNCWLCHGQEGNGQGEFSAGLNPKPVDLTDAALMARLDDRYLFWRISEGGLQPPFLSAMPAWKHLLTEQERWQLVAYLRNLTAVSEAAASSRQVGLQLLQDYGCLGCHRYAGQGVFVGPDLDDVGARADAAFIRESILDPSAKIADGFTDLMPQDYGQEIGEEDLELLVDFLAGSTGE